MLSHLTILLAWMHATRARVLDRVRRDDDDRDGGFTILEYVVAGAIAAVAVAAIATLIYNHFTAKAVDITQN